MFGKILLLISLLSLFTSCAEPKYVNAHPTDNNLSGKESIAECSITFVNSALCLSWFWEEKPTATTMGSLIFKTYRLNTFDKTPIEIDATNRPQLNLWMPSMSHGSSPTQTSRLDVGTYRTTNVFFIMPGEWQMKFQIKNGTEILDEAQINFTF